MRFLLAGALATLTAAGLAAIRPAVLTSEERAAARAIRESRMRADIRFLSGDLLEGRHLLASYAHLRDAAGAAWAKRFVDFVRQRKAQSAPPCERCAA